jgi:hypothetical protein
VLVAVQRILLTVWVGALCTVGFLVAPLLFASLDDRALAGTLAGSVFSVTAWLGLGCGLVLLVSFRLAGRSAQWRTWVVAVMLVLVSLGQFVLAPQVAALRAAGQVDSAQFASLHGMAGVLFVVTTLLGLALVAAGLDARDQSAASR